MDAVAGFVFLLQTNNNDLRKRFAIRIWIRFRHVLV